MDIPGFIVVYVCSWWLALFTVLPLWIQRDESGDPTQTAPGAPLAPNLKKKFLITSVMAAVITGIVYICIQLNVIDFAEFARDMAQEDYGE